MAELFETLPFENLYWNQMETLRREELRTLQTQRLRRTVDRVRNLPLYRDFFIKNAFKDDDFQAPEDVQLLPMTTPEMLQAQFPCAHWTVPRHEIARIQTRQGFLTAFTRHDLQAQADLAARFLYADGTRSNQLVQISMPFGRAEEAFALQSGVDCIGAASIPATNRIVSPSTQALTGFQTGDRADETIDQTLEFLTALNVNGICAEAEFVLALCSEAKERGLSLPLNYAHVPATTMGVALRYPIQKDFPLKVYLNWAHPAFFGAGLASECHLQDGLHLQEDRFLFECVHPATGLPAEDGTPGELIVTDLAREAQSLLRFRTGTLVIRNSTPCPCGRTSCRIQILGALES